MAKKIIVGVDFSAPAQAALHSAAALAARMPAELVIVHIGDVITATRESRIPSVRQYEAILKERITQERERLEAMRAELAEQGVSSRLIVVDGNPAEELSRLGREEDAALVVVGTHGRTGAKKVVFGSVAQETVRRCDRNVLVIRDGGSEAFKHILVPVDFSEHTDAAIVEALSIVEEGGRIELLHFWSVPWAIASSDGPTTHPEAFAELVEHQQQHVEVEGNALVEKFQREGIELRFEAVEGEAVAGLVERIGKFDYDLVVMGSHGRRGFRRFFVGSVAENIVVHSPCSTLVVHK
jgi:nucleotide-binding universal stress UspA family protein